MMDEDEIRAVVQATLREMIPDPTPEPAPIQLHPHRVKHRGKVIETKTERIRTYDGSRAPKGATKGSDELPDDTGDLVEWWEYDETTSRYTGPLECPDCGLGLRSGSGAPDEMICMRIPIAEKLPAGAGGIVACGLRE
jgi:hypothetical protein